MIHKRMLKKCLTIFFLIALPVMVCAAIMTPGNAFA